MVAYKKKLTDVSNEFSKVKDALVKIDEDLATARSDLGSKIKDLYERSAEAYKAGTPKLAQAEAKEVKALEQQVEFLERAQAGLQQQHTRLSPEHSRLVSVKNQYDRLAEAQDGLQRIVDHAAKIRGMMKRVMTASEKTSLRDFSKATESEWSNYRQRLAGARSTAVALDKLLVPALAETPQTLKEFEAWLEKIGGADLEKGYNSFVNDLQNALGSHVTL